MEANASPAAQYRSKSLWLDQVGDDLVRRPALHGNVECDVVVIGGGFTGLWTAYYLAVRAPQLDILVVEKETVGFGASGRNGGWAGGGIAGSQKRYAREAGWDAVRRAVTESNNTVAEVARVVEAEGIDCGYRTEGTLVAATSKPQAERLRAWFSSQQELGMLGPGEQLVTAEESTMWARVAHTEVAFRTPYCAGMQPAHLVRGLAEACERRGVRIVEGTAATSIAPRTVVTPRGSVRARWVLRATEAYTTTLPGERRTYLPLTSLVIATEPLGADQWAELGMARGMTVKDRRHLFFYAQRSWDDRLVIGGRGAPYSLFQPMAESRETNHHVRERLAETIRTSFPAAGGAEITHHWGGTLAVSRDWCMSVNLDPRTGLGAAGGYSGHGVIAANISGRTLTDLVLGEDTPLTRLPWVGHHARGWEPEPVRFLASRAIVQLTGSADNAEDRTQVQARRTTLVKPFLPPG